MPAYTPMMQQYLQIKDQYPDALLLFRLGDFYELFFEDAVTASEVLGITLTGRDAGAEERVPMCGVPYHAVDNYLVTLIENGYKVAICEQMEDPSETKGIVRRDVVRVVTPGTMLEEKGLDDKANQYIVCIVQEAARYGLASCDVSTGDMYVSEFDSTMSLWEEVLRLQPREYLVVRGQEEMLPDLGTVTAVVSIAGSLNSAALFTQFPGRSESELGFDGHPAAFAAAGTLLGYLQDTQKRTLFHVKPPVFVRGTEYLIIDTHTRRNLELVETIRDKSRKGSLLWLLDQTKTAGGARLLRRWLEKPLASRGHIEKRLDAVEALYHAYIAREELRSLFKGVYDLERLLGRVAYGSANARDLLAIRNSLRVLPAIKNVLRQVSSPLITDTAERIHLLEELADLLEKGIEDDPPLTVREGGIIKSGYHDELDGLKDVSRSGKEWIAALEQKERERTGIKTLKVGYNRVFGYYIEVTKANSGSVPDDYDRKQTLANAERYITPALKEREAQILGAADRAVELEYQLFVDIRQKVCDVLGSIQETAEAIAVIDVLQSLATVSQERGYVRPEIHEDDDLVIRDGRHPVVEAVLPAGAFVPNSVRLNSNEDQICLITGPNMGGKSTFMRQTALIVLMAQLGMFVPASAASVGLADRLFTRIGAADDLVAGQSTFMVEMVEVANILRYATNKSLVILDEIGRGTSTFDGISIAQAVLEFIHHRPGIGSRTMFATHYHELTGLALLHKGIQNYSSTVQEQGDDIVFLHQIVQRPADRSYGIQVARLAGLPESLLDRAKEILRTMEQQREGSDQAAAGTVPAEPAEEYSLETIMRETDSAAITASPAPHEAPLVPDKPSVVANGEPDSVGGAQLRFSFDVDHPIVDKIRKLNLLNTTPLQAIQLLYELQNEVLK